MLAAVEEQNAEPQGAGVKMRWTEQLDIPAQPEFVACVRRHLVDLIRYAGFSPTEAMDIAVAVSEALSNAIEHAHQNGAEPIVKVECLLDPVGLAVTIRDQGVHQWNPETIPLEADPLDSFDEISHRGRGVDFMRALTDELSIRVTNEGTEVYLFKRRSSQKHDQKSQTPPLSAPAGPEDNRHP